MSLFFGFRLKYKFLRVVLRKPRLKLDRGRNSTITRSKGTSTLSMYDNFSVWAVSKLEIRYVICYLIGFFGLYIKRTLYDEQRKQETE